MTVSSRDRRALMILAGALALFGAYAFWPEAGIPAIATAAPDTVDAAELRLARLRRIAATVAPKEDVLKKVSADLAEREKGLMRAETGPQVQAQLFTLLRRLGADEAPAIEIRQSQLGSITTLAEGAYGLAEVNVQFDCKIEQLINFLASLSAQPELIVTREIQIEAGDAKQKTVRVRMRAGAVVPKELLPAKGGSKK